MNIDYKEFTSWNGYTVEEFEFLEKTGFVESRVFAFETRDDYFEVHIGKIGDEVWYYQDDFGKIWIDNIGKVE